MRSRKAPIKITFDIDKSVIISNFKAELIELSKKMVECRKSELRKQTMRNS